MNQQTFRLAEDAFPRTQKRLARLCGYLFAGAVGVALVVTLSITTLDLTVRLVLFAAISLTAFIMTIGGYMLGLRYLRRRMDAFKVALRSNGLLVEWGSSERQRINIKHNDINGLFEHPIYGLVIRTKYRARSTTIPTDLNGYNIVRAHLGRWRTIEPNQHALYNIFNNPLSLFFLMVAGVIGLYALAVMDSLPSRLLVALTLLGGVGLAGWRLSLVKKRDWSFWGVIMVLVLVVAYVIWQVSRIWLA